MIDSGDIKEFIQSLIIAGILAFFIITFVAQSFVVDGQSMLPTFENGERLFVNKYIYRFREPERFEVVVFTPSGNPGNRFIKRVIGLPGETIYIRDGITYINGEPLKENYLREEMLGDFGPYSVPENKLFVMGDNRNNSTDSRDLNRSFSYVGFVDYSSISGKAFWVYWPLRNMRLIDH